MELVEFVDSLTSSRKNNFAFLFSSESEYRWYNALGEDENLDNLKYQSIDNWDSIGHMTLMSALESAFSITLETDDIIDFSSFKKGKEILKKYKVEIK